MAVLCELAHVSFWRNSRFFVRHFVGGARRAQLLVLRLRVERVLDVDELAARIPALRELVAIDEEVIVTAARKLRRAALHLRHGRSTAAETIR